VPGSTRVYARHAQRPNFLTGGAPWQTQPSNKDIQPLFREKDRDSMAARWDAVTPIVLTACKSRPPAIREA